MRDLKQIQLIRTAFLKKKEFCLQQLQQINLEINKKRETILKMQAYQNDYVDLNYFKISRAVPGLNKNIAAFSNKIAVVVAQTELEISNIKKNSELIQQNIQALESKIELMDLFEKKIQQALHIKTEAIEQEQADNLAVNKYIGEHYD